MMISLEVGGLHHVADADKFRSLEVYRIVFDDDNFGSLEVYTLCAMMISLEVWKFQV